MQGVRYFKNENFPPLTQKMIVTLLSCLELQNKNIPFGPTSIKGSLTTLIVRGLIVMKKDTSTGRTEYKWEVTSEAIAQLKALGIKA